ncbi:MAG: hypothetical protein IJL33_00245 [Ruminococcus sp.]|nr:hypothetical protein [Ruminococcus sp.]
MLTAEVKAAAEAEERLNRAMSIIGNVVTLLKDCREARDIMPINRLALVFENTVFDYILYPYGANSTDDEIMDELENAIEGLSEALEELNNAE